MDLVLMGDLTGSMASYHHLLKTEFIKLGNELFQFIPDLQMGIVFYLDHGQGDPYTTKVCQITNDVQAIQDFIQRTPTGHGGDEKEAVEDALYEALQINWRPKVNRSIVLFGDASGKEPHECPHQHSYFQITKDLYENQVTINSVYCRPVLSSQGLQALTPVGIGDFQKKVSNLHHPNFFSWLANVTGGMIIGIQEVGDLLEIIKASAAKDAGVLDEYEASVSKSSSKKKLDLIEISKKANHRKLENSNRLRLE
ncbi:MAG: VWA domain-containing protein [Leptospiraceae bacterium]|nr:VWA domain-containing protein [Leptospiraceae bacterium]